MYLSKYKGHQWQPYRVKDTYGENRSFIQKAILKEIMEQYFLGSGDLKPRENCLSKSMMVKVLN